MLKIETRIKNKEKSIKKTIDKIEIIEKQISGLEEARLFCLMNKEEVLRTGGYNIKCDLNLYKNWDSWPYAIGGENDNGFTCIPFFSETHHHYERNEVEVFLPEKNLLFFEEYYQKMHDKLIRNMEEMKRKLNRFYEEYGKLTYSYNTKS